MPLMASSPTTQAEDKCLHKLIAQGRASELVVVTTDWKLEDAGGKTYGMCFVRVSPPYDHMSFKRGFSLPCPTHQRCALFSLILGMELVEAIPVVTDKPEYVISTKNAWVHDILIRHKVNEWESKSRWPKHVSPLKGLLLRARDVAGELPGRSLVVCIPRDEDDPSRVSLISKEEDTDVDAITKKGVGPKEIEKALRDMRMRGVMINELIASGARGSRPKVTTQEKKKKKVAASNNNTQKEKKDDGTDARQQRAADGPHGDGQQVRPVQDHHDGPQVS